MQLVRERVALLKSRHLQDCMPVETPELSAEQVIPFLWEQ